MSKPTDPGDSTQPLSASQVVAVTPKPPPHGIVPGDQSVAWKGTVVSADAFAPMPVMRTSRAKWAVIGVLGAAAVGGGAYALWPSSTATAPAPATPDASAAPVVAPVAIDAAIDAAPTPDAATPADAATPVPADVPAKPVPPAKKPVTKKKKKKLH